jgi:ribonuclease Z
MPRLILALILALAGPAMAQPAPEAPIVVTLLGTGSPPPVMDRFGPATLLQAGGVTLLFDAGRGVTQRLWARRIPLGRVDALFLSHLHSDHVVGLPDLFLTGWLTSPFGQRPGPMRVLGPPGTARMTEHLRQAFDWDIETRIADQALPRAAAEFNTSEFTASDAMVWEHNGVRVTAFEVDHGDLIHPAFGFRIDHAGHSVVISGDTRPSAALARHAQGVDLLIHQVAAARPELLARSESWQDILNHHTTPEQAGEIFARAAPKLAVYYHLVLLNDLVVPPITLDDLLRRTRANYAGPLVVGADLMRFGIGPEGVRELR